MGPEKFYQVVKATALNDMRAFATTLGSNEAGLLKNLEDIFDTFGLGKLQISDLKKGSAIIIIQDSTIAKAYLAGGKRSKEPQCHLISGVLGGMFTYLFKKEVNCIEKECLAMGKPHCLFEVK
ncbi:hypothetical protein HY605_04490 [Candidatus Peregrinibacteria bacterium]|nr:hypothetical protein [Candidatus Peregrinibacteria bacterium]